MTKIAFEFTTAKLQLKCDPEKTCNNALGMVTPRSNPSSNDFQLHGPIARILLAAFGAIFTAGGAGAVLLSIAMVSRRPAPNPVLALCIVLVFIGVAAYGLSLLLRAIRGRSRRRFQRAQAWYLRHWYSLVLVMCSLSVGIGVARAGGPTAFLVSEGARPSLVWFGFLMLLVLPIHVAVHELGHAAAGALVKFRFSSLRVGRLTVYRDGAKFRISWSNPLFTEAFGLHHAVPEGEEALAARFALFALGGPVATVALALICRMSARSVDLDSPLASTVLSQVLWAGWLVGAYLGCVNILPLRFGAMSTDGAKILNAMLSRSPAAKAAMRATVLSLQGRRPREWGMSPEFLLSAADGSRRHREVLLLAALSVALDMGDTARVNEILHRVAVGGPLRNPAVRAEFELQAAMVEALSGNAGLARERITRLGPHPTISNYERLAEAALHLVEGRPIEARVALDAWHEALTKTRMATAIRVGNEWAEEAIRTRLGVAISS